MKIKEIFLSEKEDGAVLTAFLPYSQDTRADAILICPGGGYCMVAQGHEGENIAVAFAARGFRTFFLRYSVMEKAKFPTPLVEASLAISHIKRNAEEYGIDPERVFVMGFSAGGHLACSLGTLWHKDWLNAQLDMPYGENRPKGMILCYPVISYFPGTHMGSFLHAFGTENPTEEQINELSLDRQVDAEHTVPAFLWHTVDDQTVHVENTLRMISALRRHGVSCEAHLFPHGRHGISTADKTVMGESICEVDGRIADWVPLAAAFMKYIK